ncbi:MAG: hypothetical protein LBR45_05120, partial [Bacteroidales bacterium]|nr:hypothetical protein [Bacteroidales bacterium]
RSLSYSNIAIISYEKFIISTIRVRPGFPNIKALRITTTAVFYTKSSVIRLTQKTFSLAKS